MLLLDIYLSKLDTYNLYDWDTDHNHGFYSWQLCLLRLCLTLHWLDARQFSCPVPWLEFWIGRVKFKI